MAGLGQPRVAHIPEEHTPTQSENRPKHEANKTRGIRKWQEQLFQDNKSIYKDDLTGTQQIRLLVIAPGAWGDCIQGTLITANLNTPPKFDALSYVWGTQKRSRSIEINGKSDFRVTENAYLALRRVRHGTEFRTVWVDAICINESNPIERGEQVNFMDKIYRGAQTVVCWFGPCGSTRPGGEEQEHCKTHVFEPSGREGGYRMRSNTREWFWLGGQWGSWWERVWTIQEYCLARSVLIQFGPHKYDTQDFAAMFNVYWSRFYGNNAVADRGILLRKEQYAHPKSRADVEQASARMTERDALRAKVVRSDFQGLKLLEALRLSKSCRATNPRDVVFGVFGICRPRSRFEVDYLLPVEAVFAQAALHIGQEEGNLNILVRGWRRRALPTGESSWIPDFARYFQEDDYWSSTDQLMREQVSWRTKGTPFVLPNFDAEDMSLTVRGTSLGQIDRTSRPPEPESKCQLFIWKMPPDIQLVIAKTPIGNWYKGVSDLYDGAQVSDVIALIEGLDLPVVLRSYGDGERYVLIGRCHLHDLEKKPWEQLYKEEKLKHEIFVLVG